MSKTKRSPITCQSIWKDPLFWFFIAVGLSYGIVRNFLPTTFPILRRELGVTLEQLGQIESFFISVAYLLACLADQCSPCSGSNGLLYRALQLPVSGCF